MTIPHVILLVLWGVAIIVCAVSYYHTREEFWLWGLVLLALPLVGAWWVWSQYKDHHELPSPRRKESVEVPDDLEEIADAIPDDDPSVGDARRERAERRAAEAIKYDDASKQLERELEDLLKD